jgi:predicted adenylyl cyclase CyaB
LIEYYRADSAAARESRYSITPIDDLDEAIENMRDRFRVLGRVRKKRTLYEVGTARIHLDRVRGLGTFVEIEVVLREEESVEHGKAIVADLMKRLGIKEPDLVAQSYIDLLLEGTGLGEGIDEHT